MVLIRCLCKPGGSDLCNNHESLSGKARIVHGLAAIYNAGTHGKVVWRVILEPDKRSVLWSDIVRSGKEAVICDEHHRKHRHRHRRHHGHE